MTAFNVTRFHELLRTETFARNLVFEPSVGSTMDLARDAAHHGAPEGTLALADEQTAGRGRLGRSWVAPPATNLLSTLILRPPQSMLRQIAMAAPLAVVDALRDTCGLSSDIKWPNDVQIGGKKLAGVLIETEIEENRATALVGTGINVNVDTRKIEEIADIATSLAAELGRQIEREPLLASYLLNFERLYTEALAGVSPRGRWREALVTLGRRVTATQSGGITEGVAEDVDDGGSLLVRTDDGRLIAVEAGDVTLRT